MEIDVISGRMRLWETYRPVLVDWTCDHCRASAEDLRETPIGAMCLECWLTMEVCGVCKVGPAVYQHNEMKMCLDCYLPPMSEDYLRLEKIRIVMGKKDPLYYEHPSGSRGSSG